MAHDIAFDKMFASVRIRAWHQLGQCWPETKPPTEALVAIGGNFTVAKSPLFTNVICADGSEKMIALPGQYSLTRPPLDADPEWRSFGVVGEEYEVIDNMEIMRLLDPLSEKWPLETIGALKDGRHIFLTLSLGEWEIKGEKMQEFFLVRNGTDGKTGLQLAYTPIRVVCQNTLSSGLAAATIKANIPHRRGASEEMELRLSLLKELQEARLAGRAAFEEMAETILTGDGAQDVIERIFPLPGKTQREQLAARAQADDQTLSDTFRQMVEASRARKEAALASVQERRATVAKLFEKHNDEYPATSGTAWGLYNAVVEYADFGVATRRADPEAALFGARSAWKTEAFSLLQPR